VTLSVPLLSQVRLAPSVPPVTFDVEPTCVVRVDAVVPSIVPPDQFSVPPGAMTIAAEPVSVPPLMLVVPLKVEAPVSVRLPAYSVKLASDVSALAVCAAVVTNTVPAPDPI
jgi:hypothetical protein